MSAFQTFSASAGVFHGLAGGEAVEIKVAGAADYLPLTGAIVHRDKAAGDRVARIESQLGAGGRVDCDLVLEIPMAKYPDAAGVAGAGFPRERQDYVKVAVKRGDTVLTPKQVSVLLSSAAGMWVLGLD